MDWDLKVPPWDFAELERADNCSVDLKLGGLGYIRPLDCSENSWQPMVASAATVASSSSGSSKRLRPQSNGCQVASCSVDGCLSDLSKCREYHRRHKVCEVHSKTAIVMVGGREQRFCQQCSRFHLLVEFDEVKRSCRKRLDGHNRRRRKPQPDPQNSGSFPNQQGNRSTSYHQVSNWSMLIKTEEDPLLYAHRSPLHVIDGHQHFPVSSHGSYKEVKQFPFLQENIKISTSQPLLNTKSTAASLSNSSSKMFDSDCALSLLSSSAAIISNGNLSQVVAPDDSSIPIGQPPVPSMHYVGPGQYNSQASDNIFPNMFSCSVVEDDRDGTVLVSNGNGADFNSHCLFHDGREGSSDGNSHTLPFIWQ